MNIVLCEEFDGTKLQDLTFQWIPLSSLTKPEFTKQYISAFNFQIMSYCAHKIASQLFDETLSHDIGKLTFCPDVALLNTDNRAQFDDIYKTMIRGSFMCGPKLIDQQEKWGFYNVYNFQYPSEQDLIRVRAIIIPDSLQSVLDMEKTPWMVSLCEFIKKVNTKFRSIKILGISFGSNIIAKALGGECERMAQNCFIGKE